MLFRSIAITDSDSADALERLPGAFGTAALSTLISEKRALKALAVGGRDPSLKALSDNQYPWYKTIFLVTAANTPAEAVDFVKFVRSPASRAILGANGSLPAAHP